MELIEIPDDGIIREYIYEGKDTVIGERCIDLSDYPTVDAVDVVRCKDCKHSILWYGEITCCEGIYINCAVDENFYCAVGERKVDATD